MELATDQSASIDVTLRLLFIMVCTETTVPNTYFVLCMPFNEITIKQDGAAIYLHDRSVARKEPDIHNSKIKKKSIGHFLK